MDRVAQHVLIALAGLLVALVVYLVWFGGPEQAHRDRILKRSNPEPRPDSVLVAPAQASRPTVVQERTKIPSSVSTETRPSTKPKAPSQEPVLVAPFLVRLHAMDTNATSVPEAKIAVYQARRISDPLLSVVKPSLCNTYSGVLYPKKRLWQGLTDAAGRCTIELEFEACSVVVWKEGVGSTGYLRLWHSHPRQGEWIVTVRPRILLEGRVLRADGRPAAGVEVRFSSGAAGLGRMSERLGPERTDARGRFTKELESRVDYTLRAFDGKERSHPKTVWTRPPHPPVLKVTLEFPGGISIGGLLVDPQGKPTTGRIRAWGLPPEGKRRVVPLRAGTGTDKDGSFRLPVPEYGTYRVIGSSDKHATSPVLDVEVSQSRPHADVNLRLLGLRVIAGRVCHQDGRPVGGAWVRLRVESPRPKGPNGEPLSGLLHGSHRPIQTASDGSFRFDSVHPDPTYSVTCRPEPLRKELEVEQGGIKAGATDVELRVRPEDLRVAKITVTVRRDDTGAIVKYFSVKRLWVDAEGKMRSGGAQWESVHSEDGSYSLSDLAMNKRYALLVRTSQFKARLLGPILITKAEHHAELRLVAPGSVLVRVTDAAGNPAVNIAVVPRRKHYISGTGIPGSKKTNVEGVCEFPRLAPGKYDFYTWHNGKSSKKRLVEVLTGQKVEVALGLPN